MKPKDGLAITIFPLARQELIKGAAASSSSATHNASLRRRLVEDCNGMHDTMPPRFFPLSVASTPEPRTDRIRTYFRIWKCANDQLHAFGRGGSQEFQTLRNWKQQHNPKPKCIVGAIRDPLFHFLSAYNEIESRIDEFRADREKAAKTLPFYNLKAGSTKRFQQLIIDLLDCPMARDYTKASLIPIPANKLGRST
jgi:hypothetical protein